MTEAFAYSNNQFAQEIYGSIRKANFGNNFRIVPVTSLQVVEELKNSEIKGLDYRAKIEPEEGFASVFEGLAFDPENIRSQSIALYEGNEPIGVMTQVIAPGKLVEKQRYFERREDGIYVRDFNIIGGQGVPDFLIIPAWTKVAQRHLSRFAVPGFRAFQNAMSKIVENTPKNTWIEATATGQSPFEQRSTLLEVSKLGINAFVPNDKLPFNKNLIGKNSDGSSSSVKMAHLMGLRRIENIGSVMSLGPVFAKRLS